MSYCLSIKSKYLKRLFLKIQSTSLFDFVNPTILKTNKQNQYSYLLVSFYWVLCLSRYEGNLDITHKEIVSLANCIIKITLKSIEGTKMLGYIFKNAVLFNAQSKIS